MYSYEKQRDADLKAMAMTLAYMAVLLTSIATCVASVAYFAHSAWGLVALVMLAAFPRFRVNVGAPPPPKHEEKLSG